MPRMLAGFQDMQAHTHRRRLARGFRRCQRKEQPGSFPPGSRYSPSSLDVWATPGRGGSGGWKGVWGRMESRPTVLDGS